MKKVNAVAAEVWQKYWIPIALFLLTAASFISGDVGVFTALVFTFLVPGLIAYRFFRSNDLLFVVGSGLLATYYPR